MRETIRLSRQRLTDAVGPIPGRDGRATNPYGSPERIDIGAANHDRVRRRIGHHPLQLWVTVVRWLP